VKEIEILPAEESSRPLPRGWTSPLARILVLDRDPYLGRISAQVLCHFGYEADASSEGAATWQTPGTGTYDLLIAGHQRSDLSAIEFLKKLRGARMAMPVIIVTAVLPKRALAQYGRLQPAATLLKPYTMVDLLYAVRRILNAPRGVPKNIALPPPDRRHSSGDIVSIRRF
jgi:DNA-binding response OmpR family regulator